MQNAETVLGVLRERGRRGLPCDELYRQLFNPQLYLLPGSPGESHPQAPTDPDVNLSIYPARAAQVSGRIPQRPVREQAGLPFPDPLQPISCTGFTASESLVLPPRPAHQMAIDTLANRGHRARVERGEVVQPAP
jgi:hypothetical protein